MRDVISPSSFHAELQQRRSVLAFSPNDREELYELAARVHDDKAERAADQIVALVHAGRRPSAESIHAWARGGAVFWLPEHTSLGEGWPLHGWFGDGPSSLPLDQPTEAARLLRDEWDQFQPFGQLFGEIPIVSSDGRAAVMISACGFASADRPLCVVRSTAVFMRLVRMTGTLWGPDFPDGNPMLADDTVLAQCLARAQVFYRP